MKNPLSEKSKIFWAQLFYQGALILLYAFFFGRLYPSANGTIGSDYQYFFPHLLDGYFWYLENGFFTIPWFSPGFCGGLPAWANPQNIFYSLPQILTFAFGPLRGVFITVLVFAWLGYIGMYMLARKVFNVRPIGATLAATLFALNGFFMSRMAIGHLAFHPFMLTPLLACFILAPLPPAQNRLQTLSLALLYSVLGGFIWACMFYGGMLVLLIQVIVCLLGVLCLYGLFNDNLKSALCRFALAGLIGMAMSLSRLTAVFAFVGNFPRNDYEIPGSTFLESIELFFRTLILPAMWTFSPTIISHAQWNPQLHEYDFSITPVPFIIIAAGLIYAMMKHRGGLIRGITARKGLYAILLTGILVLPWALNYYTPGWHAFLKTIPVVKTASTMIRWYVIYVIILIIAAMICLEHSGLFQKIKTPLAIAAILTALIIFVFQPAEYYKGEYYDPSDIVASYDAHKSEALHPQVNDVVMFADEKGQQVVTNRDNDVITIQATQLYCYEPIFGYNLENFPRKTLQPGPIRKETDGVLNLKNPACYVYPLENNCRPGDHFTPTQKDNMANFAAYRPYPFAVAARQTLADRISLITLVTGLLFLLVFAGIHIRRKFSKSPLEPN